MADKPHNIPVRLTIRENGKQSNLRPIVANRNDFEELLRTAKNKLRLKAAKRAFTKDGEEIFNLQSIPEDASIVISTGTDFVGYTKDAETKEMEKHAAVVGLHEKTKAEGIVDTTKATSELPKMRLVVGLPDLHPGKGFPIGSASVSEDVIYPHLVGADIGCGMSLWKTSIKAKKAAGQLDKWAEALNGLEQGWPGDTGSWLKAFNAPETNYDAGSLGTIGGGNHFAELQQVEKILEPELFQQIGLDQDQLYLLVHSGSRGYGEEILKLHLDQHGHHGLLADSPEAKEYLTRHDSAMYWAKANRALIAHKFLECITCEPISRKNCTDKKDVTADGTECIFDIWHNNVTQKEFEMPIKTLEELEGQPQQGEPAVQRKSLWLHRKGAAPSDIGPVVIPGSRGHYSYLVSPTNLDSSAHSLAHGAGRKWNRGKALQVGKADKKLAQQLTTTDLGSRVICENKDLLLEEVPQAYKEIDDIIADLKHFKLIKVVAVFRPLITYKTRVVKYSK